MADDLPWALGDIQHEVPHSKNCLENSGNGSFTDCSRKYRAGYCDYLGLYGLNRSRSSIVRHNARLRFECTAKPEDEGFYRDVVCNSHWGILHCIGSSPKFG